MSGWICVVTPGEVAVVGRDNGVLVSLLDVLTIPLADARAACVGKYGTSKLPQSLSLCEEKKLIKI